MDASISTILLVSKDRDVLRRLTTVLATTGCRLQQTSHTEHAAALLATDPPEILILDASPSLTAVSGLLRIADSDRQGRRPYTLLIADKPTREDILAAVEGGANDFLRKPIASGELLARVRAGELFRKCERRLLDLGGSHTVTGLPGFAAFEFRLHRELSRPGRKQGTPSLVIVDIDFFYAVAHLHSETTATALLRAAGQTLHEAADGSASVYALGQDRFAAILPGATEEEAVSWADRIRETLAELEFSEKEQRVLVTASCGVAACDADVDAERLFENALDGLRLAKSLGRDYVARHGEFAEESPVEDSATPLKLLLDSIARDVFTPCALQLRAKDSLADAAALFRRTRLPACAVVDTSGEVAGLLTRDAARKARDSAVAARVEDVMSRDVAKFDEQTDFITLLQYFAQHPDAVAIVVHKGTPTGLLTSDSLVAPVDSAEGHPVSERDSIAWESALDANPV